GNEPSPAEAAMQIAYTMAAGQNEEILEILESVVLVIDPLLNPDGHERYAAFYDNVVGQSPNANPDAAEHDEPWPGGRTNHYLFDLNRDWLWLVHPESRTRLPVYRKYKPQLHIDHHEQGATSPFFFGAGDDPYNTNIPDETREWIELYGAHNAEVFDREGLVYATKERFDYLYPGYGKVLPVYHGAVGMLTEKGGHGFAGLALEISDQYTLTLRERARHHFLVGMSYLETTAKNREGQLERFRRYFEESMEPEDGGDHAFVISSANDPALLQKTWDLCDAHGIEVHETTGAATARGLRSYRTGEAGNVELPAGSWVIPAGQPMGRLARALFERSTEVTVLETYDITGWSLPISFGLEAWYATEGLNLRTRRLEDWSAPAARVGGDGDVALVISAGQHAFPRAVGAAVRHDLFARRAGGETEVGGVVYPAGSLIIHTVRNKRRDLDAFVEEVIAAGVNVERVSGGITERGHVLGADDNRLFDLPKVLVLRDSPVSSYSFGQVWHLLDVEAQMPHTTVNVDALSRVDLDDYNVLVVPEAWGALTGSLGSSTMDDLKEWVR
ncbi:MAG: M14 family zinc carboxypeptidase, partial [Planctomycetota bacterium]|nr:M14 family zinc carboxypeptidase [Planctomycetota bacterium]